MSETFGETSKQWACLAARLLGWRPQEFWQSTPAELATALSDPEHEARGIAAPSQDLIARMMERDKHDR